VLRVAEPEATGAVEHVQKLVRCVLAAVAGELDDPLGEQLDLEETPVGALVRLQRVLHEPTIRPRPEDLIIDTGATTREDRTL
jgi:hypothetical protein